MREFLKPVNLISIALAVIATAWGFYSHYSSLQRPSLSFVKLTKIVFDAHGEFRLSERPDVRKLELTRFVFWNSGNIPIGTNDLRRPLQILSSSNTKILHAEISKQYPEYGGFSVVKNNSASGVELAWKFFDPQFSFVVDVYHTGSADELIGNVSYVGDRNILHEKPIVLPFYYPFLAGVLYAAAVTSFAVILLRAINFVAFRYFKKRVIPSRFNSIVMFIFVFGPAFWAKDPAIFFVRSMAGLQLHDVAYAEIIEMGKKGE